MEFRSAAQGRHFVSGAPGLWAVLQSISPWISSAERKGPRKKKKKNLNPKLRSASTKDRGPASSSEHTLSRRVVWGFRVLAFRVWGLGFGVWGLGLGV